MKEKKKIGRPRSPEGVIRVNVVLTPNSVKMLDAIMDATGAASRSEAIRTLIYNKHAELTNK